jgi:hypothetical protein
MVRSEMLRPALGCLKHLLSCGGHPRGPDWVAVNTPIPSANRKNKLFFFVKSRRCRSRPLNKNSLFLSGHSRGVSAAGQGWAGMPPPFLLKKLLRCILRIRNASSPTSNITLDGSGTLDTLGPAKKMPE